LYYFRILQGRWQHGEEVGNWYPNGLEKPICKWDVYFMLVMKGLKSLLLAVYVNTFSPVLEFRHLLLA
jgi:hypothetical protein